MAKKPPLKQAPEPAPEQAEAASPENAPEKPPGMTPGNSAQSPPAGSLKRALQPMPPDIRVRLDIAGLRAAYDLRPAYQRNDYLAWIGRAKRPATRDKRINQMLDELEGGTTYMKMLWKKPGSC